MLKLFRNSLFVRYFWGLMALYFLNCSIDPVDVFEQNVQENLAYNDQESIIELVTEKVLGFENAIPEHDDHDAEQGKQMKKNTRADFFETKSELSTCKPVHLLNNTKHPCLNSVSLRTPFLEISSPPPEV
jgi:hypothetical protein